MFFCDKQKKMVNKSSELCKVALVFLAFLTDMAYCRLPNEADEILGQIVHDLGLSKLPDVQKANVSLTEYSTKLSIYQQSVEQTSAVKRLKAHFHAHLAQQADLTTLRHTGLSRRKRSLEHKYVLRFDLSELLTTPGAVLVNSAILTVNLKRSDTVDTTSDGRVCAVQLVEEDEGIQLDCVHMGDDDSIPSRLRIDVTHAVQAWALNGDSNKGLLINSDLFQVDEDTDMFINVESISGLVVRQRRDIFLSTEILVAQAPGRTDCKTGPSGRRCCRQHMTVNLRELEGFEFIMQPAEFDAYYCVGKCPPRYLPRNDHSLLQSLLHLKHRGGGKGIKRPCCSPSKFESIDILHLDEQDSTRLKVTNWKNIIVSECACA